MKVFLKLMFNYIFQCRSRIRDLAEKKYGRSPSGDVKPNSWTLLDFGMHYLYFTLMINECSVRDDGCTRNLDREPIRKKQLVLN